MSKYRKPLEVSIPESQDLGFCTVNQVSELPFTILNPNLKPISYSFKFTKFIVIPSKGILMPNSISNFKIQFVPSQANVIVGTVVMQIEGQQSRVFKFSAVGKYPYISMNDTQIDFGEVLTTKNVTRDLILKNSSQVPAKFSFKPTMISQSQFNDTFYHFQPSFGQIPPKLSFNVKVNYNPQFVQTKNISKFQMICESGNKTELITKGYSNSFNVYFQNSSINFGEIKLDMVSTKVLTIINNSELQTQFQFYTDPNNIFGFSQIKGIIGQNTYKKIIIEFRPQNTITYYQRVYCLVRNHLLLHVDLIGTCYDLLIRPLPLTQNHIDIFRKRVIEGRISKIELKYIQNNLLLRMDKKNVDDEEQIKTEENFYSRLTPSIVQHPYVLHKELMLENICNEIISISEEYLEFGFCDIMTISSQKQIEVVNKLNTKLTLYWIPQKRQNLNGEYMKVFNVFPQSATLKPNIPTKFNITFRPLKSSQYYFQHLQFYAIKSNPKISKKTLEEYELREMKSRPQTTLLRNVKISQTIQSKIKQDLDSTQIFPPLSGNLRCVGHSFSPNSLPFLPIMKFSPNKQVTFKPCLKNYSVYDSVKLINQSDTPIYYKFGPDPHKVFRIYPKIGMIEPMSFSIVTLQFTPKQYKTYLSNISIYLNDMQGNSPKLTLIGTCTPPQLKLENDGKIFFAPSSTGVYTKKEFTIENLTKTKVTYKIQIPQKYQQQVYFDPQEKILQANQSFKANVYFTPLSKRPYKIKIPVKAYESTPQYDLQIGYHKPASIRPKDELAEHQQNRVYKEFFIQIIGQGIDGSLKLSQQSIDFNSIKITESKKLNFQLQNNSQGTFYVELTLKNNDFESQNPPTDLQINSAFNLDFKQGKIPGNSAIDVNLTFNPIEVLKFNLKLVVTAKDKAPRKIPIGSKIIDSSIKCEMQVKADGNYPQMEIIDIRNDTLSVAALWENFQISHINSQLSQKLSNAQKKYLSLVNLTFNQAKSLEQELKIYDWNMGYVSTKHKAKPRKVIISVRNYGGTPLDYTFKFPSNNKVQQQLWADPGEPTPEQAYERAILQKNIFQIKPKIGHLQPNQVKDIELIYRPITINLNKNQNSNNQVHFLRVVFQISNGKSLIFNLKGTTLGPNQGLITVKKTQYILPQTPIGLMVPLRFPIEMNNVGSIKVTYKAQIQYQGDQFQEVFKIQNPSNFLLPGQTSYLYCLYKPLVVKKYNFKIKMKIFDFSKMIQSIDLSIVGNPLKKIKAPLQTAIMKNVPGKKTKVSQFGSKVFFSIEEIDFGVMMPCETKYRMIILYNMSKENALNFDFPTQTTINTAKPGLTCGDKFIIQPAVGTLQPDSFIELKLKLTSTKYPSIYEGQIACNITWSQVPFSMMENDVTQKQAALLSQKQSLFLHLSKSSCLQNQQINKVKDRGFQLKNIENKSIIDCIFDNIINSSLNQFDLEQGINKLSEEEASILDLINEQNPVSISKLNEQIPRAEQDEKRDYSKYEYLMLNQQFNQISELIMQNTFFNIIQQTTHRQNDFLRIAKKFIQADRI